MTSQAIRKWPPCAAIAPAGHAAPSQRDRIYGAARIPKNVRATIGAAIAVCLVALIGGCVAPQTVKDASAQHTRNLAALETAVKAQQSRIDAYYDDLIESQRQAFVATAARAKINEFIVKASKSEPKDIVGDSASNNFISWGEELTDVIRTASKDFDLRITPNGDLASTDTPGRMGDAEDDKKVLAQEAKHMASTKKQLHDGLDLLLAQLAVMKKTHAIIDDDIATDATLDGAAIGKALTAGAGAAPADLTEISKLFPKKAGGTQ